MSGSVNLAFATPAYRRDWGDCPVSPSWVEVNLSIPFLLEIPGGGVSPSVGNQQLQTIARGVVKGAGVVGDPKYIAVFYLASAGLGGLGATAPEIYGGVKAVGYWGLGEYLTNALEISEGLDAFFADLPAVTSVGSAVGAGLNIVRTSACRIQDDEPSYCF